MTYHLVPNYSDEVASKYGIDHPITECGLVLETSFRVTKGKEGLMNWCHRFFWIECENLQDAVIKSVHPQVSCLDGVKDMVRDFAHEEGVEVDLNNLEITFDHFWWNTIQEL